MNKFGDQSKKIVDLLGLKWAPIAGKFTRSSKRTKNTLRKINICDAIDMVRRESLTISLTKENCTCPGGRHFTGLQLLSSETIASALTKKSHRVYATMDAAIASVNKQPQPVPRGKRLVLAPLTKFETEPDLVLLFVNPAQADRILGLIAFHGAEPFMYYPASSICSTITNVLAKGRPEINLISTFERRQNKWSQDEFIVAMTLKDFEEAVKNIRDSGFGEVETE
jgi:uncharacterized protein (DUF169 family)